MEDLSRLAIHARDGQEHALECFVSRAYEQVWRLCAMLVDEQAASDLAQETFVRAVRELAGFRGDSSARTWLLAIARHVCMDELRARHRQRRRDRTIFTGPAGSEHLGADAGEEALVADLLRRLEPERRAAFVLTQMIGLSYEDAALVCECPSGTIRSRVARARADLLGLLGHPARAKTRRSGGRASA